MRSKVVHRTTRPSRVPHTHARHHPAPKEYDRIAARDCMRVEGEIDRKDCTPRPGRPAGSSRIRHRLEGEAAPVPPARAHVNGAAAAAPTCAAPLGRARAVNGPSPSPAARIQFKAARGRPGHVLIMAPAGRIGSESGEGSMGGRHVQGLLNRTVHGGCRGQTYARAIAGNYYYHRTGQDRRRSRPRARVSVRRGKIPRRGQWGDHDSMACLLALYGTRLVPFL